MIKPLIKIILFITILFSTTVTTLAGEKHSMAYMLTVIDGGVPLSESDITVTHFKSLLKQLDATYVENTQQIGDMTVAIRKVLREKYGVKVSIKSIMEGMNQIFCSNIENQKYAEYIAAYATLRKKGISHKEAINSLRSLVNSLLSS